MKLDKCEHCSATLGGGKRYNEGKCYCPNCYTLFFKLRKCSRCGQRKRISKLQEEPICKECLYKNTPCIKCGKICLRITQVTRNGAICTACSNKSKIHAPCDWCHSTKHPSFNRNIMTKNEKAYICDSCYNKTLPKCSLCSRRRPPIIYSLTKEPICKYCAIEDKRQCKSCGADFPAGAGNYCLVCKQIKAFNKRVNISQSYFGTQFSTLFKQFAYWLKKRRGVQFTSVHLLNYVEYFQAIEKLTIQLNHTPTYKELVNHFTVATTREYLSVTLFLNEIKFIEIVRTVQEEFSNLDMIERQLKTFEKETPYYQYLTSYYETLLIKLENNKTSIRSIRLALSPAVGFLKVCQQSNIKIPSNDTLYAFLWATTGQIASVTGFIGFLNKSYRLNLKSPKMVKLSLSRETKGKKQLQQSLIQLLRNSDLNSEEEKQQLFKLSIGYFHGVAVPQYMRLADRLVSMTGSNVGYFKMCYESFYLPESIINRLR